MDDEDIMAVERRKFALDKAIATSKSHERPAEIVERAEVFDAFLRGGEKDD